MSKVIDNQKDEAEAAVETPINTAEDKVPIRITDDDWRYPEDSAISMQKHIEIYQAVDTDNTENVDGDSQSVSSYSQQV